MSASEHQKRRNSLKESKSFLIIVGTARDGRNTIRPAKTINSEFQSQGHETYFYDLKEKNIPPVGNRTYADEEPVPEDIKELKSQVMEADCIVLVTPEYNHSIPGVLKTAMDYLYPEYDHKPFAFVSVSAGGFGGVRALNHLHEIALEYGGYAGPELPVSNVAETFPEDGEPDDGYRKRIEDFVDQTANFVDRINCRKQENIEAVKQLYRDIWSGENLDAADEIVAEDYSFSHSSFQDENTGPERIKETAREMLEAFPDMETRIDEIISSGDRIAVRWTMTGTHKGSFQGEEATGKEVELEGIEFLRFEDGKLVEHHAQSDMLGLKKQMGAIFED